MKETVYRARKFFYGPRFGRRRGYYRGYGFRQVSPNCDWYPDRPRGWWALPEYQSQSDVYQNPPFLGRVIWDENYKPENLEELNHGISMLEEEIERLRKEISRLTSLKESTK